LATQNETQSGNKFHSEKKFFGKIFLAICWYQRFHLESGSTKKGSNWLFSSFPVKTTENAGAKINFLSGTMVTLMGNGR